ARGDGGWDWRRCPPGLLDASEQAVSWELTRAGGVTVVRVRAVAAPGLTREVPTHLRPHAVVDTGTGTVDAPLRLSGDAWHGSAETASEVVARVDVHVPGVGPAVADPIEPAARARIRTLAAERLRRATEPEDTGTGIDALLAEIAAAGQDSDF